MLSRDFRRLVGIALVLSTTFITMPVSAADFTSARQVIGSVSAVGSVDLRGVGISQEGTLFPGDSIRAHEKGYAKVLLETGTKIELYENTDVSMNRDSQGVKIAMNTGNLGFTAKSPLRVDVAPFEVIASDDSSGIVQVKSPTTAGVRAVKGKVLVRNLKTSESFVLLKGQEQLLGLPGGTHAKPLGQVASNVPMVPPGSPAPQTPAGKSGPGLAMDTGAWLAVIGAGGLAAVSIWALVEAHNNNNDINSLKNQINNLNNTIASNQAATAAQIKTLQAAAALSANLAQQQAALNLELSNEQQALAALQASGQGNTPQAAALKASITQTTNALASVNNTQASAAACAANPATCNTATLQTLNNSTLSTTNGAINNGNGSVQGAGQINNGVTGGSVGTINNVTLSASVPL